MSALATRSSGVAGVSMPLCSEAPSFRPVERPEGKGRKFNSRFNLKLFMAQDLCLGRVYFKRKVYLLHSSSCLA